MTRPGFIGLALTLMAGGPAEGVTRVVPKSFMNKAPQVRPQTNSYTANACATHIAHAEKLHGIPENLLHAIAKTESGKITEKGKFVAWPWTVNAEGQSYYYRTKNEAICAVREMQARGITSIDVGCMQVNLHHHAKAFKSLNIAFDPSHNTAYAAKFLKKLNTKHKDWHKAVAHYHSATPAHHIPYQKKVLARWEGEKSAGPGFKKAVYTASAEKTPASVYRGWKRVAPHSGKMKVTESDSAPRIQRVGRITGKAILKAPLMAQASSGPVIHRIASKR